MYYIPALLYPITLLNCAVLTFLLSRPFIMPNLIPPKIPDGEKVDFDVREWKTGFASLHMFRPYLTLKRLDVMLEYTVQSFELSRIV